MRCRMVRAAAGLAPSLLGFGGCKQLGSVDLSDGPAGVKGNGEIRAGNMVRDFSNGEKVIRLLGEESVLELATQGFDGFANACQRVPRIFHEGMPGGTGKTDLKREVGHSRLFPEGVLA